jgi:hypothetical protein
MKAKNQLIFNIFVMKYKYYHKHMFMNNALNACKATA